MHNLFAFIYRYRAFLVFVILEVVCGYLMVRNNAYHSAAFYTTSNHYVGRVLDFQKEVSDYFRLATVNSALARENAELRQMVLRYRQASLPDSIVAQADSLPYAWFQLDTGQAAVPVATYALIPAKVINNSISNTNNFLTLNVGLEDGVEPGMGVICANGVVGRVKAASAHYATVTSVLHSQTLISAKVLRNGAFGSVKWDAAEHDYTRATLDYITPDVALQQGDTVVTSGFNAIFPEGVRVGSIREYSKEPDKSFYTIDLDLSVDFPRLSYVYVIRNNRKGERDSLEAQSGI